MKKKKCLNLARNKFSEKLGLSRARWLERGLPLWEGGAGHAAVALPNEELFLLLGTTATGLGFKVCQLGST